MKKCGFEDVWIEGYTVGHTVTYFSSHVFYVLFCFIFVVYIFLYFLLTGRIQGWKADTRGRLMNGTRVQDDWVVKSHWLLFQKTRI